MVSVILGFFVIVRICVWDFCLGLLWLWLVVDGCYVVFRCLFCDFCEIVFSSCLLYCDVVVLCWLCCFWYWCCVSSMGFWFGSCWVCNWLWVICSGSGVVILMCVWFVCDWVCWDVLVVLGWFVWVLWCLFCVFYSGLIFFLR